MRDVLRSVRWGVAMAAALGYFMMGALWYSPVLFGPAWRATIGLSTSPEVNSVWAFVVPFLGALSATLASAVLSALINVRSRLHGAALGAFVALSYSVAAVGIDAVAPHQPHPLTYTLIVGGYHLVCLTLVGALTIPRKTK